MEFELKLEKADWHVFNTYLCKRLSLKNKTLFDNFFFSVFIWMIIGFVIIIILKMFGGFHWPTAAVTSLVFVFVYLIIFYKNKKIQTAFEPMDNGSFCRAHIYKFSEEGISTGDGTISWDMILKIERAQGMIMLYMDTAFALIFPEHKLEHPDKFYEYISAQYSNVINQ